MGIMSAVCGLVPPVMTGWAAFALCCVGLGASGNVHTIPLMAYIQETAAPEKMGRAFSVLTLISSVTMPVGLLFSSPIAEKAGVDHFGSGDCDHHGSYFVPVPHEIQKEKILIHCAAAFLLI